MRLSWKLGRVEGIDLFLHPSALLFFLIGAHWMPTGIESVLLVLGLLGSIVLHELGHALMARRYGIGTADITLYMFGGIARLERMPRSSGPELLIALAGPAVNFGIVAILGVLLMAADGVAAPLIPLLSRLSMINLGLGLFNLLPVFPMDGGRVLRALLSSWIGRLRATEIAAGLGRVLAIAGGIFCLLNFHEMYTTLILVGFVYLAGSMELQQVRSEGRGSAGADGFVNFPEPPPGYRWADRGDGVWRPVPIMVQSQWRGRSWS
jgi:Zn-dependent protease